jgi:hypothetical protein
VILKAFYLAAAFLVSGAAVHACDGVSALTGSCYSQNLRQRIVVEKIVEPQYVERIVQRVEYPRVERIVVRERVKRDRVRLQLNRSKVVRRERIVERSY